MHFIKLSKPIDIHNFEAYVKKYTGLWKLKFQLLRKDPRRSGRWEFIP